MPTPARATAGDWFKLDIGSGTDTVNLTSKSPNQILTLALFDELGVTQLATVSTTLGNPAALLDIATVGGFSAGTYLLKITADGTARYDLQLGISRYVSGDGSDGTPFKVGNLNLFEPQRDTAALGADETDPVGDTWFEFTLAQPGGLGEGLGIRGLNSTAADAVASTVNLLQLQLLDFNDNILQTVVTTDQDPTAVIDLAGLARAIIEFAFPVCGC